jgi:hypothetical protein
MKLSRGQRVTPCGIIEANSGDWGAAAASREYGLGVLAGGRPSSCSFFITRTRAATKEYDAFGDSRDHLVA